MDPKRLTIFLVASVFAFALFAMVQERLVPPMELAPEAAPEGPRETPAPATDASVVAAPAPAAVEEAEPRRVVVQTPDARLEMSNVGGRVTSWKLLNHGEYGRKDVPVELVRRRLPPPEKGAEPVRAPGTLEASDDQDVLPFQILTGDVGLDTRIARARHVLEHVSEGGRHVVTAQWSDGAGTSIVKKLTIVDGDPLVLVEARLTVGGRPAPFHLLWGPGFANHDPEDRKNTYLRRGEVRWRSAGKVHSAARPDDAEELPEQPAGWAAIEDSFFCALFIPGAPEGPEAARTSAAGFRVVGELQPNEKGKTDKKQWPEELVLAVPFGPDATTSLLYVGPREKTVLAALEARVPGERALESLVHLGLLDPIASAMHSILLWLHLHVGSWGLAIVLLTLIIRGAIFPFTHMSLKKNRVLQDKMKVVQPRLKALQEKYRKQPRSSENLVRLREEQAALYAEADVNPAQMLGGCIPMLLSTPFFFALLRLLPNAPEFRHEPFLWWPDLSSGDPTHVWPILMAVTMFVSTKMGMSSAPAMDPMQRNMFLVLPLVFTFFCWSAPLGLVVYWTVSNVVQIGQQQLLKLMLPTPESQVGKTPRRPVARRAPPPAAEPAPAETKPRKKGRKR
jgi:YidC/Oxa1 family membrane protein insertase